MSIHSYDLIGGNFLVWSDKAKIAPPPLYATLRLQHVSEEGWQILQEIKALGAWTSEKTPDKSEPKKSRRKQTKVRHIVVKVEQQQQEEESEEDNDDNDSDEYVPQGSRSRPKVKEKEKDKDEDDDYQVGSSDDEEESDEEYTPVKVCRFFFVFF